MGSEHLAQRGVEQMGRRVMAAGGGAQLGVDDGDELFADGDGLARSDLVRADALHGRVHAFDFGDDHGAVGGVEPAFVANLAAALGVEGSVVEDEFGRFSGAEFAARLGRSTTMARTSQFGGLLLLVAFEDGLRQRGKDRGCGLLRAALPTGAGGGALLFHGGVEAGLIEVNALIAGGIGHEVERQAEGVVELEGFVSGQQVVLGVIEEILQLGESDGTVLAKRVSSALDDLGDARGGSASSG